MFALLLGGAFWLYRGLTSSDEGPFPGSGLAPQVNGESLSAAVGGDRPGALSQVPGARDDRRATRALVPEPREAPAAPARQSELGGRVVSIDPTLRAPFRVSLVRMARAAAPGSGASGASGVSESAGAARAEGRQRTIPTDDQGAFDFGELAPGTWELAVYEGPRPEHVSGSAPGPGAETPSWARELLSSRPRSRAGRLTHREVVLVPGGRLDTELRVGRQSSDSAHLTGFLVDARPEQFSYEVQLHTANEQGEAVEISRSPDHGGAFDFGFVPPGSSQVLVFGELRGTATKWSLGVEALELHAGEVREVALRVAATCRVTFDPVDAASGSSLEGAVVYLAEAERGTTSTLHKFSGPPSVLWCGSYEVLATAPGHRLARQSLVIGEDDDPLHVRLELQPAESIPSVLLDQAGLVLGDTEVHISAIEGAPLDMSMSLHSRTSSEGVFDAGFLAPGTYSVLLTREVGAEVWSAVGTLVFLGAPGEVRFEPGE